MYIDPAYEAHYEANKELYEGIATIMHETLHRTLGDQAEHDSALQGIELGFLLGLRLACEYQRIALRVHRRLWGDGVILPTAIDMIAGQLVNYVSAPPPDEAEWFNRIKKMAEEYGSRRDSSGD